MKKYTVYTFPSLHGAPREFQYLIQARIYAFFCPGVCELENNETGEYFAYWA